MPNLTMLSYAILISQQFEADSVPLPVLTET
jgi:hypothetical protein